MRHFSAALFRLYKSETMTDAWCESKYTTGADWRSGDTVHPEEVKIWKQYLNGTLSADDTAQALTVTLQREAEQGCKAWHPWTILDDALIELPGERHRIIRLCHAIRGLWERPTAQGTEAPSSKTNKIMDFGHLWADCHRSHMWGRTDVEKNFATLSAAHIQAVSKEQASVGRAEAELATEGIFPITWGLETMAHLLEQEGVAVELYIAGVFAWLDVAAKQLWSELPQVPKQVWASIGHRRGGIGIEDPPIRHWMFWKLRLQEIEKADNSRDVRMYARKCLEKMEEAES